LRDALVSHGFVKGVCFFTMVTAREFDAFAAVLYRNVFHGPYQGFADAAFAGSFGDDEGGKPSDVPAGVKHWYDVDARDAEHVRARACDQDTIGCTDGEVCQTLARRGWVGCVPEFV